MHEWETEKVLHSCNWIIPETFQCHSSLLFPNSITWSPPPANPHMQLVSIQSSVKHMWSTRTDSVLGLQCEPKQMVVYPEMTRCSMGMYPNAPVLHIDQTRTEHTLAHSLLPPPFCHSSLTSSASLHMCSSFLHWPINHVRSHTQSCTLCSRESSYRQANRHTHTHTHTHTEPNPSLLSQRPHATHTNTSSSLSVFLSRAPFLFIWQPSI